MICALSRNLFSSEKLSGAVLTSHSRKKLQQDVANYTLFSDPGNNEERFLPTHNREQDIKPVSGLKRQKGFKSLGFLDLSKINVLSQKSGEKNGKKGRNKRRHAEKRRRKSRDSGNGETLTSVLCEMGCEE